MGFADLALSISYGLRGLAMGWQLATDDRLRQKWVFFYPLGLELDQARSSYTYFLQPWSFKKCRSTHFLCRPKPFQSAFPFRSQFTAGQQVGHGADWHGRCLFTVLSASVWLPVLGGKGCFLDTGQHGGGEDLLQNLRDLLGVHSDKRPASWQSSLEPGCLVP